MTFQRLNAQQFLQFQEFIYELCGIRVDTHKVTMLSNRIRSRLRAGNFEDFDVYYRFLTSKEGREELSGFVDAITTNETSFFRTQWQFDWFVADFLDEVTRDHRKGLRPATLDIWSAGCSNGAEPYTLAMCVDEHQYKLRDWNVNIVGTDISDEALKAAREGLYRSSMLKQVSDAQRKRYFHEAHDDRWQVRSQIKKRVRFENDNLLHTHEGILYDCIFIRNVLIYFDQASKRTVMRNLIARLKPDGYLVLGPSEGVHEMVQNLEKVSPSIFRNRDSNRRPPRRGADRTDGEATS